MRRLHFAFAGALAVAICPLSASGQKPACEDAKRDELTQRIAKRWPGAAVRLCAAGNFGAPGYVIAVFGEKLARIGILDASGGRDLAEFIDLNNRGVAVSIVGFGAADLDGDGVDEVIEWWRRSAHGRMGSDNWLDVRRIEKGKLGALISGPHTSVYFPEIGSCSASWKAAAGAIHITVENTRELPPSVCLPVGLHRFKLESGTLVKVP